jgi:hypothetical protein
LVNASLIIRAAEAALFRWLNLARAFEPARRIAGNGVPVHAGFADVNALIDFSGIEILVSLRDAVALLIGVLDLFRARREAEGQRCQDTKPSHLHDAPSAP